MAQFWPKIIEAYILGSTLGFFFQILVHDTVQQEQYTKWGY